MTSEKKGILINAVHPRTMTMGIVIAISFSSLFIFSVFYRSLSDTIDIFLEAWSVFVCLLLTFSWIIWSEFTHKVSWDDEAVYFRPQCEPWEVRARPIARMKFEDMTSINRKTPDKIRYNPNMMMRIFGVVDPKNQYDDILEIKIENFKRSSFEDFIYFLKEKRPDFFESLSLPIMVSRLQVRPNVRYPPQSRRFSLSRSLSRYARPGDILASRIDRRQICFETKPKERR